MSDWQDRAACIGVVGDVFFTPDMSDLSEYSRRYLRVYQERTAKAICGGCPVRDECLAFAIANDESGIWGGLTADEREALKPGRKRQRRRAS